MKGTVAVRGPCSSQSVCVQCHKPLRRFPFRVKGAMLCVHCYGEDKYPQQSSAYVITALLYNSRGG